MGNNEQQSALQQELLHTKAASWDIQQRAQRTIEELSNGYRQLTETLVQIGELCGVKPTDKGLDIDAVMQRVKVAFASEGDTE